MSIRVLSVLCATLACLLSFPSVSFAITCDCCCKLEDGSYESIQDTCSGVSGCEECCDTGCPYAISGSVSVDASYCSSEPETYTLTVIISPDETRGRVTGQGIDCPGDCTEEYAPETTVNLTAHEVEDGVDDWGIAFWTMLGSDIYQESMSVVMHFDKSVTANFAVGKKTACCYERISFEVDRRTHWIFCPATSTKKNCCDSKLPDGYSQTYKVGGCYSPGATQPLLFLD